MTRLTQEQFDAVCDVLRRELGPEPKPTIEAGQLRMWNYSQERITILKQRTEEPYDGEWLYRYDNGRKGLMAADDLLSLTTLISPVAEAEHE